MMSEQTDVTAQNALCSNVAEHCRSGDFVSEAALGRDGMRQCPNITVILDRLRSAHNTGNIFRLAEALGAKEVICCGYTPCPPHPKLAKTAMGADTMVPSRSFPTALDAINTLREETPGIEILAVEPLPEAVDAWAYPYRFPVALIFGNEALGISPEALEAADAAVGLPMFGEKASINVGNCAAVVLYAAAAKFLADTRR